jgi:alkylation response protein AidB-like acyl-CoA dehydrogenase
MDASISRETLETLARNAASADGQPRWPGESWDALRHAGIMGWSVAESQGGQGKSYPELLKGYETLAGACLTTCFILSQREAAVRRLLASENERLTGEVLPALVRGESFATVGLSQLTTSRQHLQPALTARLTGDSLVLDGTIPWVTGAAQSDHIIIGAVLEDGLQVLAVLPTALPKVKIGPPLELMALQGSLTAEIHCDQVALDRRWLLAGPVEIVMAGGRGGAGGLETSCLAIGLAGAAVAFLQEEARSRPDLQTPAGRLEQALGKARTQMYRLAAGGSAPDEAAALRTHANKLVLRATQAALTAAKGTGFLRSHPAQRWARQAMFFLVWSCPGPVARAALASFACDADGEWLS